MPNNRTTAENRHRSLQRKLQKEPELWKKLTELVEGYRTKGFMREVTDTERETTANLPKWFLPVFAVHNHNKPEKVRLIWDAGAKTNGMSLNDQLLPGPDLNAPLVNVLMSFRNGKIAISGDVQEMFLQLVVREEDRAVQRFLWQGFGEKVAKEQGYTYKDESRFSEVIFWRGNSGNANRF